MTSPHILVVEDEPHAREAMASLLADEGYRVTSVADGVAALDLARRDLPSIVVSDINMPRGGGFDLVKGLRTYAGTAHVPIILLSAVSETERRVHGLDLGADDFLAKPVDIDELLARIRAHLRRAQDREALERRTLVDALTGVLNRRGIAAELLREMQRARRGETPLSVLMIDVDRFKSINDNYGHQAGDTVLRHVSNVVSSAVRVVDHVGRYGGDEFLVILPGADAEAASVLAGRLRSLRLPRLAVPSAVEIDVTVSIGVATLRPDDTAQELVERADQAMYRVKRASGPIVTAT